MTSITSFSKARKARERETRQAEADANSLRHGRTKAERLADAVREEKARAQLDAHRFDDE